MLKFRPNIAPIKVAVLPLSKNDVLRPLPGGSTTCCGPLDDASTTRRRRSADATAARTRLGTPVCVTVDFQSVGEDGDPGDDAVTIRERDSQGQVRVPVSGFIDALRERLPLLALRAGRAASFAVFGERPRSAFGAEVERAEVVCAAPRRRADPLPAMAASSPRRLAAPYWRQLSPSGRWAPRSRARTVCERSRTDAGWQADASIGSGGDWGSRRVPMYRFNRT